MMLLVAMILMIPLCATAAGLIVSVAYRHESLDDADLLKHFMIVLVICGASAWAVGRTDAARLRLDPQFRIQTEIEAHPVYAAVKQLDPEEARKLNEFLGERMSGGDTLPQAFLQARPHLTDVVTQRLGFADQQSRLMWGGFVVDTLKELRASDPSLCYEWMAGRAPDRQTLEHEFSADNAKAFELAAIRIYEAANRGMRREYPPDDKPADFNRTALEFHAIQEGVSQQYGQSIADLIAKRGFGTSPTALPEQMCSARIFQLEAMLERPKATAALLIDSALR